MKDSILNFTEHIKKILFIFCIFVTPLVFLTDTTQNPFNIQLLVLAWAGGGLICLQGLKTLLKREVNFTPSLTDKLLLLFVVVCAASVVYNYFYSPYPSAVLSEALRRGSLLLISCAAYFLAKSIKPYDGEEKKHIPPYPLFAWGFLWLLYPVFKSAGVFDFYALIVWAAGIFICYKHLEKFNASRVSDILLSVGAIAALYGAMQSLGLDVIWNIDISGEFGKRAVSTFGNPNFLSSYLVMLLPLALYRFLSAKKGGEKFYYFGFIILYSLYLAVSLTRSSWLGALCGIIVLFIFADFRALFSARKKRFIFVLLAALAVFFAWPQNTGGTYGSAAAVRLEQSAKAKELKDLTLNASASQINQSYHQRLMMWTCGLKTLKKSPLLGGGWGSFQMNYALCQGGLVLQNPALSPLLTQANAAHNELVEVVSQSGILGLVIYISFFAAFVFLFARRFKTLNVKQRLFYAALFAGLCGIFKDNMLNITLQTAVVGFMFWFVLSIAGGREEKLKKINYSAAALIFLLCAAALVWPVRQSMVFASDIYAFKGGKAFARQNYTLARFNLEKSLKLSADKAEAFYNLINTLIKLNEKEIALNTASDALKRFPAYYEFSFLSASLNHSNGNSAQSTQNLKTVLNLNPAHKDAAYAFAQNIMQDKTLQTEESAKLLKKIEGCFKDDAYFALYSAQALDLCGQTRQAADVARAALAKDSFNASIAQVLENIDKKLNITDDAVLLKAQELENFRKRLKDVDALHKGAQKDFERVAQKYPKDLDAVMLVAEFYFKTQNYSAAQQQLLSIYANNADNKNLNFALSSVYEAQKNAVKSAFYLQEVLRLDPSDAQAAKRLAKINLEQSQKNSLQKPLN